MITTVLDDATLTVEHDGHHWHADDRGNRQRYRYTIATEQWTHTGNDINSGVGAEPNEREALGTLASFLSACAESRKYGGGENADLFPDNVGEWAEANSDELALLADTGDNCPGPRGAHLADDTRGNRYLKSTCTAVISPRGAHDTVTTRRGASQALPPPGKRIKTLKDFASTGEVDDDRSDVTGSDVTGRADRDEESEMMSGTEMAALFPATAARVVLTCEREGGDVENATGVLVSAVGRTEADRLIEAERNR